VIQLPGEINIEGPGHEEKFDLQYDKKYTLGNTKAYVVAPKISREESNKRWQDVCTVASKVARQMIDRGINLTDGR
jgi:hypothetical protein